MDSIKDIPGYEGLYGITKRGIVWSHYRKKWLRPVVHHTGYVMSCLRKDGKSKNIYNHKLVMITYNGPSNLIVNHINGVKSDNRLSNLEYSTHKENSIHAVNLGLIKPVNGEAQWNSRFKKKEIIEIREMFFDKKIPQFIIAKHFNTTKSNIIRILTRDVWGHLDDGYPKYKPGKLAKGECHPCAKINSKTVKEIRNKYKVLSKYKTNMKDLSEEYKLNKTTIFNIVKRNSWKHVK